MTQVKNN